MLGHEIPLAFAQGILCLLPKSDQGKYRGIALLETLYKLCTMIYHLRWQKAIEFHPGIHDWLAVASTDFGKQASPLPISAQETSSVRSNAITLQQS